MLFRIGRIGARRSGVLSRRCGVLAPSGDLDLCKGRVVDPGLFALELDDSEGRTVSVGLGDLERGCPCRGGGGGLCVLSEDLPLPLPGISPSATSDLAFRPN